MQVVEIMPTSEKEQSKALRILLGMITKSKKHSQAFIDMSGYNMLVKVLSHKQCQIGHEILMVRIEH